MEFDFQEALDWYKKQGAPSDQPSLVSLLKEIQQNSGGSIPQWAVTRTAESYGVKETFLQAIIKRYPSLRLSDTHCLELCGGPNCSKRARLAEFVEKTYGTKPAGFTLKYTGCMRMCGKGPNLRWDGKLYHGADEALIRKLIETKEK